MAATLENGHFYGRAAAPLRIDDVVLTETTYSAGFVVPMHAHAQPFFCLPVSGAFTEHLERTRRVQQTRVAFYHPREQDHAETFDHGPARLFNIQLGGGWLERLAAFDVQLPDHHVPLPEGRVPALALQLHDEYRLGGERLIIEGLLLALVGELNRRAAVRERRGSPPWLGDVVEAIRSEDPEHSGLTSLARMAGVHPAHLARTFRARHGCTPGEYARRLRVDRARDLLADAALPIARIAVQCGFADQSHFTRVFRRQVGMTPAEYRRRNRVRRPDDPRAEC